MEWHNEPPEWQASGDAITVTAAPRTDFWRKTHDGGVRHNGHFYYRDVRGNFEASVKVSGQYAALYDQAGLMARLDEATWLKCGVELLDGVQQASAVVTRDFSDWSVVPLPGNPPCIHLRLTRHGFTFEVRYALEGQPYTLLRQAFLTPIQTVQVGLMCCAPTGEGFTMTFEGFHLEP